MYIYACIWIHHVHTLTCPKCVCISMRMDVRTYMHACTCLHCAICVYISVRLYLFPDVYLSIKWTRGLFVRETLPVWQLLPPIRYVYLYFLWFSQSTKEIWRRSRFTVQNSLPACFHKLINYPDLELEILFVVGHHWITGGVCLLANTAFQFSQLIFNAFTDPLVKSWKFSYFYLSWYQFCSGFIRQRSIFIFPKLCVNYVLKRPSPA